LTLDRHRVFQLFKYAVYALLTINIFVFFAEEWAALSHRFAGGIALGEVIEGFAQTIDTTSWVILLLMFELETSVLADDAGKRARLSMHALRALCYIVIVYAFYGYLTKLLFLFGAEPLPGVSDLCRLAGNGWAYTIDLDEYAVLTAANCASFSSADHFYQLPGLNAVVDRTGLSDITRLAWTDVINSGVWLLVVFLLEVDVRLQARNGLEGLALRVSNGAKYVMYTVLLLAAIYWGVKGDFVDFWDAFLWLAAFFFIEMNVVDRREESLEAEAVPAL
jgi:hypothetical protein